MRADAILRPHLAEAAGRPSPPLDLAELIAFGVVFADPPVFVPFLFQMIPNDQDSEDFALARTLSVCMPPGLGGWGMSCACLAARVACSRTRHY